MTSAWLLTLLSVALIAASALFVAAEFAVISARRTQIEPLAVHGARARTVIAALEDVQVMLACAQLGITVCGVLLGALGEPALAALLEPVFHALHVPEGALHPVSLVIGLLIVVGAHVALGEMVPKNIALADPERTALALVPGLRLVATVLGPVVRGLSALANVIVRWTGAEPKDEVTSAFSRDEVAGLVAESGAEGLLAGSEGALVNSALVFDRVRVEAVMVPSDRVIALTLGVSAVEVEAACARTGFSRFPVRRRAGGFAGYLHIRDVLGVQESARSRPWPAERLRTLPVVVAGTGVRHALEAMRASGAHLAEVVSDAAPGAGAESIHLGIVTLEDLIEQLIGEVRDATRPR